jgi:mannose-1-phosphate guanylyltransferase/mannose-6-phosphate isomerase
MDGGNFSDAVILAGGFGERLWPASKAEFPKQFLSADDGISFLQSAVKRALDLNLSGKILIVTRKEICPTLTEQVAELAENSGGKFREKIQNDLFVIAEPFPRHTCAPLLLSCKFLEKFGGERTILVLASDHVIFPAEKFTADCRKAATFAQKGKFVCFAIPPTEASTGYGYIKFGAELEKNSVYEIENFREKPDAKTAQEYFESGRYSWNSGMFGFTADFFQGEIRKFEGEMYESFKIFDDEPLPEIQKINGINFIADWRAMDEAYKNAKSIAVDNAVAERTKNAAAVKATFSWDDVGSWDSFEKFFAEKTKNTVSVESAGNFVFSDAPVALCGVENLIVVAKNGKILVMKKGKSDFMREVVKKFKENSDGEK